MRQGELRRLLRVHFSRPKPVIVGVVAALIVILASIAQPLIVGEAVEQAIGEGRRAALIPLAAALVAASAVKSVAISIRKRLAGYAAIHTEARLRGQMYEHLQALDVAYHEQTPIGQLMSRASSDLKATQDFLAMIPITIGMSAFLVLVTVTMFIIDPPLALVALATMPPLAWIAARLTAKLHPIVYDTQQRLAEVSATVEETVTGIRVVKAFGREAHQVERLRADAEHVLDRATAMIRVRALLQPLFELLPALGMAAVLWYGAHRALAGSIDFGELVTFFLFMTQLSWPVRMMGWVAADGQRASTASQRIFEVLDTQPGIADREVSRQLNLTSGSVRFERVAYSPPEGRRVLDGIELEVLPGTSLALVGPAGCGKSTLLKLVLRFVEPSSGRILLDGQDISEATLESLRAQTGMVFEDTFLFSDTIASNISFGRPDAREDEVVSAAALAQAHDFITDLPDGYDTFVGEQGFTLSGGQRQRIAIARAILMDPKILLLDDPTSSVDAKVEAEIRAGLREAMRGRTTLLVARRPASAALADRVAFMTGGKIVATGTHDELWESVPEYSEALAAETPVLSRQEAGR
ncbi:MAG: ABC transporter ATP-binding protein [Actinomycetota bacterium]